MKKKKQKEEILNFFCKKQLQKVQENATGERWEGGE